MALASGYQEFVQVIRNKLHILSGAVFQDELKTRGGANAGYRRRREAENSPLRQSAEFLIQSSFYFLILFRSALAIAPGFQRNEEETVVAGVGEAEQIEVDNRCSVLKFWIV